MELERELATYERLRDALLASEGQWAAISGDELIGVYEDYSLALRGAYAACGLDKRFLVKKIEAIEQPVLITRLIL